MARKPIPMKQETEVSVNQTDTFSKFKFHTFFGEERISYHAALGTLPKRSDVSVYVSDDPALHDEEQAALERCRQLLAERKAKSKKKPEPVKAEFKPPKLPPRLPGF